MGEKRFRNWTVPGEVCNGGEGNGLGVGIGLGESGGEEKVGERRVRGGGEEEEIAVCHCGADPTNAKLVHFNGDD